LAVASNGDVYVGGNFSQAGGVVAHGVARWNGTAWNSVEAGTGNLNPLNISEIVIGSNGDVYAGGSFTRTGGTTQSVARWNGTAWSILGAGPAVANSYVYQLAMASNGDIYVGLGISSAFSPTTGIITASAVSKWDGMSWRIIGSGLDYYTSSLAFGPNGKLYVGGMFSGTGDGSKAMVRFGIYDPSAVLATAPAASRAMAALFPNPAHGTATLRLPAGAARQPLTLTDALGRTVRRYPAPTAADAELDLRGLPAGVYSVRCGQLTQRLVVE
jgi:hypothetical protein